MDDTHDHDSVVHDHGHEHVTHYRRPGEEWEHMTATHDHDHNHPAVSHEHEAHQDPEKEHEREAHIHDHAHPTESPG